MSGFTLWVSKRKAAEYGCTHHARIFGMIPGFVGDIETDCPMWVSRSDLLNPVEDAIGFLWSFIQATRGDEPSSGFRVGKPIQ